MSFNKYSSLTLIRPNREEEIQKYSIMMEGERCVVTEKIHGANFAMDYDGEKHESWRRRDAIAEGESFYGHQYIEKYYRPVVEEIYKELKEVLAAHMAAYAAATDQGHEANLPEIDPDFKHLTIRGELCGGHFPETEQLKEGHGQVGKGGIWYSQSKEFLVFSIEIDGKPLDFYNVVAICRSNRLSLVPILFWGTFDECLEYSKEHLNEPSVVSSMQMRLDADGKPLMENDNYVHLPFLKDNIREGHVISSVRPFRLPNEKAAIFKHKGDKFLEDNGKANKSAKTKTPVELNENQKDLFSSLATCLVPERLKSVESKHGEFERKDFNKAIGLVIQDAIEELWGTGYGLFAVGWESLKTKERKVLMKELTREATTRLREEFFN